MKQITSNEFRDAVKQNPAWARTLTEPVQITGICNMLGSHITHLSPLLHFKNTAIFEGCLALETAEGHFAAGVDFSKSGIKKIGELTAGPNAFGLHICFNDCKLHIPPKFLGTGYQMGEELRQESRRRNLAIAASKAVSTAPDLEI